MPGPDAPPRPRRRFRLSVRGLLLLVAAVGLALGLGQFYLANLNTDRALLSYQMRLLADRETPAESRVGAIDGMAQARGRQARRALRLLTATLDEPDPILRAEAARMIPRLALRVLGDAGPTGAETARPAVRALLDALDDPSPAVALEAILGLPPLIRTESSPVDREEFIDRALSLLREDRMRLPEWADARREAINQLAALHSEAEDAPEWFLAAMEDPDPRIRYAAFTGLLSRPYLDRSDPGVRAAPAWFLRALDDEDADVRGAAVGQSSVWTPGIASRRLTPRWANPGEVGAALLRGLDRAEGHERLMRILQLAINAPDAAAPFAPEVIRGFEEGLDGDIPGAYLHLSVLEALGPAAGPAVPALCRAVHEWLETQSVWDCPRLVNLVTSLDPESDEARELLDRLLSYWMKDPSYSNLLTAIAGYGPAARAKVERLLRDGSLGAYERENLQMILKQIDADPALGPLDAIEPE